MPKTIDILIGVSLVMLVVSLAVTALTQFILGALNTRGRNLRAGLAELLRQIDPTLEKRIAGKIASAVLTHPLIAGQGGRRGAVVHREEFTKLLMDIGSGQSIKEVSPTVWQPLAQLLRQNGISNPIETLKSIRLTALELERKQPQLAEDVRHSMAIITNATSDLVAKVNSWFDRTIDRVGGRFTASTRAVTFFCALLIACAVQLDSVALINGLSVNDQLRTQLTAQAIKGVQLQQDKTAGQGLADVSQTEVGQNLAQYLNNLAQFGIISVPHTYADYKGWPNHLAGIILSTLLLSLGAPFWYSTLSSLLRLRSTLAEKDDVQRNVRQSSQTSDSPSPAPSAADPRQSLLAANEQGNLEAIT
jgi:hypothetical protein